MEKAGIINLLKPAGMTSHDGVAFLRRVTGIKRIGHTGTLDPMAVGVLPICIGTATRIMDYLDMDEKAYRCEMILGLTTDTQDIWGTVIDDRRDLVPSIEESHISNTFLSQIGEIYQMPPSYSAVRIRGKHLYEYARQGQEVEAAARPVIIRKIELIKCNRETGRVLFDVTCSKGTYIRSICHEVGEQLGCGATMSFLIRTASGRFSIEDSVTIEALKESWEEHLLPTDYPLDILGRISIPENRVPWFKTGGQLRLDEVQIERKNAVIAKTNHIRIRDGLDLAHAVYGEGRFLGVVLYDESRKLFIADKVFIQ